MKKLTDHLYSLTHYGFVNFYVWVGQNGLTVVDCGIGGGIVARLERGLAALGHKLSDINTILVTHAHFDHIGGLAALQAATRARVIAHPLEAAIIRGEAKTVWASYRDLRGIPWLVRPFLIDMKLPPVQVDHEVEDGASLDEVIVGLQVVHLPGHSYGQIGFWLPQQCVLLGGDVMQHRLGRLTLPLRAATPDWEEAKRSVRKAAALRPQIIGVGHGQPVTRNADRLLDEFMRRIEPQ